jgi:hypothetical protein
MSLVQRRGFFGQIAGLIGVAVGLKPPEKPTIHEMTVQPRQTTTLPNGWTVVCGVSTEASGSPGPNDPIVIKYMRGQ